LLWTSAPLHPPPYVKAPKKSSKKATTEPEEGAGGAGDEEVIAHDEPAKKVSELRRDAPPSDMTQFSLRVAGPSPIQPFLPYSQQKKGKKKSG